MTEKRTESTDLTASDGGLEKWKLIYNVRKKIMFRRRWGFHDNSTSLYWTITRVVPEVWVTKHVKFRRAWNIYQILTRERLNREREKIPKVARNIGNVWLLCSLWWQRMTFNFEPTAIWRSKVPHFFKPFKNLLRPMSMQYFSNKKAWMGSDANTVKCA